MGEPGFCVAARVSFACCQLVLCDAGLRVSSPTIAIQPLFVAEGARQGDLFCCASKKATSFTVGTAGSCTTSMGDALGFLAVVTRWEVRRYTVLRDVL